MASATGFDQQEIECESALLTELFGENDWHAHSANGLAKLPSIAPVEVDLIVALW